VIVQVKLKDGGMKMAFSTNISLYFENLIQGTAIVTMEDE